MGLNIKGYSLDLFLYLYDSFYNEKFRIPKYYEYWFDMPLGSLYRTVSRIIRQGKRQEDGSFVCGKYYLTGDEYKELSDRLIGFKRTLDWDEVFELFKSYYEEYNRYPKCYEEYKGYSLGHWVITQRMIYNNGVLQKDGSLVYNSNILTKEQIDKLNSIGFAWTSFDVYLNLLKDYIKEYNEYPKYNTIYKEENLGNWVCRIRLIKKNGELQEDGSILYRTSRLEKSEIEKLDNMDFVWNVDKKEPVFDHNFEILKEYYEKGLTCDVYRGLNIKTWSIQLRTTLNKGEEISDGVYRYQHNSALTFDNAKKLDSIDFDFINRNRKHYYNEIFNSSDILDKKKRLLLLKTERLLSKKLEFNNKDDIDSINKEFISLVYKNKR